MLIELQKLNERYKEERGYITNEVAAKQSLVLPFFEILGYNTTSSREFQAEYSADVGTKNCEKVDYLIKKDDQPIILLECKAVHEKLSNYYTQLYRYFSAMIKKGGVSLAILTNGLEYRFYADLDKNNILDDEPFFVFDLRSFDEKDVEYLKIFEKSKFSPEKIQNLAQQLREEQQIQQAIARLFEHPTDEMVKAIIQPKNTGDLEKYRKIIVDCLRDYKKPETIAPVLIDTQPIKAEQTTLEGVEIFLCSVNHKRGKYNAQGILLPSVKVRVLKGSVAVEKLTQSDKSSTLRACLLNEGVLAKEDTQFVFTCDYEFKTPSAASGLIMGNSSNGWNDWKDKDGHSIQKYRKKK